METVYYYIADSKPDEAVNLLTSKYNYHVDSDYTIDEIALALQDIVNSDGETALRDVMNIHPDKMVILELNSTDKSSADNSSNGTVSMPSIPSLHSYQSRDSYKYDRGFLGSPTNILIGAALILGVIAISRK